MFYRFYKTGKCHWCKRAGIKVFLTTFESETSKFMCDRCKEMITHQRKVRDNIDNGVDLWDETNIKYFEDVLLYSKREDNEHQPYRKQDRFIIEQTRDKNVTLYGYRKLPKFVVEFYNETSLQIDKLRVWEYFYLGPAKRRFKLCEEINGRFQNNKFR